MNHSQSVEFICDIKIIKTDLTRLFLTLFHVSHTCLHMFFTLASVVVAHTHQRDTLLIYTWKCVPPINFNGLFLLISCSVPFCVCLIAELEVGKISRSFHFNLLCRLENSASNESIWFEKLTFFPFKVSVYEASRSKCVFFTFLNNNCMIEISLSNSRASERMKNEKSQPLVGRIYVAPLAETIWLYAYVQFCWSVFQNIIAPSVPNTFIR